MIQALYQALQNSVSLGKCICIQSIKANTNMHSLAGVLNIFARCVPLQHEHRFNGLQMP